MSDETLRTLIIAVLGAGGATFLWTVVKSILAFRDSAEGREDKAVARLETYERDCREQLILERRWTAYWQHRAASLEFLLRVNGVTVPDPEPEPVGYRRTYE